MFLYVAGKCSINYTEPNEKNLDYLYKDGDTVKLKQNHKYFTQFLMPMGVTKTKNAHFVVWTTHGMVIDNITFDKELWESMKSNFETFYKDFNVQCKRIVWFTQLLNVKSHIRGKILLSWRGSHSWKSQLFLQKDILVLRSFWLCFNQFSKYGESTCQ